MERKYEGKERRQGGMSEGRVLALVIALLTAFLIPSASYVYSKGQDNAILTDLVGELKHTRLAVQSLNEKAFIIKADVNSNRAWVKRLDDKVFTIEQVLGEHGNYIAVLRSHSKFKSVPVDDKRDDGSL